MSTHDNAVKLVTEVIEKVWDLPTEELWKIKNAAETAAYICEIDLKKRAASP